MPANKKTPWFLQVEVLSVALGILALLLVCSWTGDRLKKMSSFVLRQGIYLSADDHGKTTEVSPGVLVSKGWYVRPIGDVKKEIVIFDERIPQPPKEKAHELALVVFGDQSMTWVPKEYVKNP